MVAYLLLVMACDAEGERPAVVEGRDTGASTTDGGADRDGDGYPAAEDCDDTDRAVNPGAAEVCGGGNRDEDCDGRVNDDDPSVAGRQTVYDDRDGDGRGDPATGASACAVGAGQSRNGTDWDDGDPAVWLAPDTYVGDLTWRQGRFIGFCDGYRARRIDGSVSIYDLPVADVAASVASLSCVAEITGNLLLNHQEAGLADLSGLRSLTAVGGHLYIGPLSTLPRLSGLSRLREVGGKLYIGSIWDLRSLGGMEGLSSVGENLEIYSLPRLRSLDGLGGLTSVGGSLFLFRDESLVDLRGLDSLTIVGRDLLIQGNDQLRSLDGLSSLRAAGSVYLRVNHALSDISALSGLSSALWTLDIGNCDALTSLEGLGSVPAVGTLSLRQNPALEDISALTLTDISADLTLYRNDRLASLAGLEGVTEIGRDVSIIVQLGLDSLAGLENLTAIGGSLYVSTIGGPTDLRDLRRLRRVGGDLHLSYTRLRSLAGLDQLREIGDSLFIEQNSSLLALDGLGALTSARRIEITRNSQLCDADIDALLSHLPDATVYDRAENTGLCQ